MLLKWLVCGSVNYWTPAKYLGSIVRTQTALCVGAYQTGHWSGFSVFISCMPSSPKLACDTGMDSWIYGYIAYNDTYIIR
jgi:hypothetical protein